MTRSGLSTAVISVVFTRLAISAEIPKSQASSLGDKSIAKDDDSNQHADACLAHKIWSDTSEVSCSVGRPCSVDGRMPFERGLCVRGHTGPLSPSQPHRTECWDVCNPAYVPQDYAAMTYPAPHVLLRVVQTRQGLIGGVNCPCKEAGLTRMSFSKIMPNSEPNSSSDSTARQMLAEPTKTGQTRSAQIVDAARGAKSDGATGLKDVRVALLVVGKVAPASANILLELMGEESVITETCTKENLKLLWLRADGNDYHPIQVATNLCEYLARRRPYVFRFERLPVGTRLEILVAEGLKYNNEAHVSTPQPHAQDEKLGVISCNKLSYRLEEVPDNEDVWDGLKEKVSKGELDGILHLGDQVYLDNDRAKVEEIEGGKIGQHGRTKEEILAWCPYCRAETLLRSLSQDKWESHAESIRESFRDNYRKTWGHPPTAYVLANTKNYFITDDHEIRDDLGDEPEEFDTTSIQFFLSRLAFEVAWEYQYALMGPWTEPQTRAYYYASLADNIGVFMIDPRIARSILIEGNAPEEERLLQQKQWEMLRTTLAPDGAASDWDVLLLGTPTPLAYYSTFSTNILKSSIDDAEGAWSASPKELNNLLQLIETWQKAKSGRKVVVVAGDIHHAGHTGIYPRWGGEPVFMQLTSSAVSNREYHTFLTRFQIFQLDLLNYIRQQIGDYSYEHKGWTNDRNFGVLDINAPPGEDPVIVQKLYVSDGNYGSKLHSEYSIDTFGWSLPTELYLVISAILFGIPCLQRYCFSLFTHSGTQNQLEDAPTPQKASLEYREGTEGIEGTGGTEGLRWNTGKALEEAKDDPLTGNAFDTSEAVTKLWRTI